MLPGLQRVDVVVVDLGRLGEDLLVGHHAQELRLADAPRPFLPQLGAVLAQVGHQLLQQRVVGRARRSIVLLLGLTGRSFMASRTAGAGSVEEEAGDRGGHVLPAERRRRREHADDQPDQRLGQTGARDVVADVSAGLTPFEEAAQRLGEPALEPLRIGASPLASQKDEGVSDVDEGAHGPGDALLRRHLVDPGRRQPGIDVVHGCPRQLVEQGLAVREVAVDRRPSDAGRLGDVVHARLLSLDGEDPRGPVEDRRGHALLQRVSGSRLGHRRLPLSLRLRLTRR